MAIVLDFIAGLLYAGSGWLLQLDIELLFHRPQRGEVVVELLSVNRAELLVQAGALISETPESTLRMTIALGSGH